MLQQALPPIPDAVPLRRLDFDVPPEAVPRDFYAGDPSLTLVMAALSVVFPEGERFFVESVQRFKDRIQDPELAGRVRGFAAQEAMHSKEHAWLNELIRAQGLEVMARLGEETRVLLQRPRKLRSPEEQLAITCALEHITAILGEQLLRDDAHREAIHQELRGLWAWHALEELEHKDVAFDVYQAVDGSYVRRVTHMALATFGLFVFVGRAHWLMLRERGLSRDLPTHARTFGYLWGRPGLFRRLVPAYLAYFRPGFHPSQLDTSGLVEAWRRRLFGEGGELRARLDRGSRRERRAA